MRTLTIKHRHLIGHLCSGTRFFDRGLTGLRLGGCIIWQFNIDFGCRGIEQQLNTCCDLTIWAVLQII